MADRPKPVPANKKTFNSDRPNRKAFKRSKGQGSHTRGVHLTELQKALIGGGAMRRIMRPAPGNEPEPKVKVPA